MHLEYIYIYRSFWLTKSIWSLCQSLSCSSSSSITVCGTSPRTPSLSETLSNKSKKNIRISQTLINVLKNMKTSELHVLSLCPMIQKFHLDIEAQLQFTLQIHCIYPIGHLKNWQSITPFEYLTSLWTPCCSNLQHF